MAGGRPSKIEEVFYKKLPELIQMNWSDAKIAQVFGVTQQTISYWKKSNSEFFVTYNIEQEKKNSNVEKALYNRAVGTKVKETRTVESDKGLSTTEIVRELPPDTEAAKFWLVNRRPETWAVKEQPPLDAAITINLSVPRPGDAVATNTIEAETITIPRPQLNGNGHKS